MEETDIVSTDEVQSQPEENEQPESLRETLEKNWNELQSKGEETEEVKSRTRDEKGRFSKKEEETTLVETPQIEAAQELIEPTESTTEEPEPFVVPPELQKLGLKKEEAEEFVKAPEVLKQAFLRRSEEMHKGIEQFKQRSQTAESLIAAVSPYMRDIQAVGATPESAIAALFNSERQLRYGNPQQKVQMLVKLAGDYGIDLNQAAEYRANQPPIDPQVQSYMQQMHHQLQQAQAINQRYQQTEQQTLNSEIQRFASDPANVHFEAVRVEMAALIQAGLATSLKEAYDKAIYANPTIRDQVLAQQQAKARTDAAQKAQVAKSAAAANMPKTAKLSGVAPVGSMRETLIAAAQRMGIQ